MKGKKKRKKMMVSNNETLFLSNDYNTRVLLKSLTSSGITVDSKTNGIVIYGENVLGVLSKIHT